MFVPFHGEKGTHGTGVGLQEVGLGADVVGLDELECCAKHFQDYFLVEEDRLLGGIFEGRRIVLGFLEMLSDRV